MLRFIVISERVLTQNYSNGCRCGCALDRLFTATMILFIVVYTQPLLLLKIETDLNDCVPINAIHGVETNNLWILVESLSKSYCLLNILSNALALKFSPRVT